MTEETKEDLMGEFMSAVDKALIKISEEDERFKSLAVAVVGIDLPTKEGTGHYAMVTNVLEHKHESLFKLLHHLSVQELQNLEEKASA